MTSLTEIVKGEKDICNNGSMFFGGLTEEDHYFPPKKTACVNQVHYIPYNHKKLAVNLLFSKNDLDFFLDFADSLVLFPFSFFSLLTITGPHWTALNDKKCQICQK